jgi:hypothetical protein
MSAPLPTSEPSTESTRWVARAAIWLPGLVVALGAAVVTAHGLYEVAVAARVPAAIAWLYPLITDGLALVAYAATARLSGAGRRYAWLVVVLAAGLSGLAQAAYLAGDAVGHLAQQPDVVFEAPPALRFGVGAWPAIAAAIVAHLLYLLVTDAATGRTTEAPSGGGQEERSPSAGSSVGVQPELYSADSVQPSGVSPHSPVAGPDVQRSNGAVSDTPGSARRAGTGERSSWRSTESPARDRAVAAASQHARRHGVLPTVTELEGLADVSRGTAAGALKSLRERPTPAAADHHDRRGHTDL